MNGCRGILLGMRWRGMQWSLLLVAAGPVCAQNAPFGFEGLADSTILANQYPGAGFSGTIVLAAGISLNDLEFPPHAGSNVAGDNGGPINISFASPLRAFSGYFTYNVTLTMQALGSSNQVLTSASSQFSHNEAISGAAGSHPNEVISVRSTTGISKITITGSTQGASFTVDDATAITLCDLNQDGYTNVRDAQAILNEALGATAPADDLNGDGVINVVDVQALINASLGMACIAQ
jgi:hypothetical protein